MDKCDRTVPVYAGESKTQLVRIGFSPFQVTLAATGTARFAVCSAQGRPATLYARKGEPVKLADGASGGIAITADGSVDVTQACSTGGAVVELPSAGTWYLLLESADGDTYLIDADATGFAARPASAAAPTCALPTLQTGTGGGGTGGGTGGSGGTGGASGGATNGGGGKGGCSSGGAAGLPMLLVAVAVLLRRPRAAAHAISASRRTLH